MTLNILPQTTGICVSISNIMSGSGILLLQKGVFRYVEKINENIKKVHFK